MYHNFKIICLIYDRYVARLAQITLLNSTNTYFKTISNYFAPKHVYRQPMCSNKHLLVDISIWWPYIEIHCSEFFLEWTHPYINRLRIFDFGSQSVWWKTNSTAPTFFSSTASSKVLLSHSFVCLDVLWIILYECFFHIWNV